MHCLKYDNATRNEGGASGATCGSATPDGLSALFDLQVPRARQAERRQLDVTSRDAGVFRRQTDDMTDTDAQEYEEFCVLTPG
eukprot:5995352-Heterocapsa_arctica.AAC.1